MNFLGLNSPAIFVISVIILTILGPKKVEKGWLLFQRLLKFLLSNEEDISKDKLNLGSQLNLKEEVVEEKSVEAEVIEAKEEVVEEKSVKAEVIEAKKEVVDEKSVEAEVIEAKEEAVESKSKRKKPKQNKILKEN